MVMTGSVSVFCARTFVFFRLEVFAGLRETVHQRLEFVLGVGRNRRVISKQHVYDEGFTYFCFGSEAGEVEQHAV